MNQVKALWEGMLRSWEVWQQQHLGPNLPAWPQWRGSSTSGSAAVPPPQLRSGLTACSLSAALVPTPSSRPGVPARLWSLQRPL